MRKKIRSPNHKWDRTAIRTILYRYLCGGCALKESRSVSHGRLFLSQCGINGIDVGAEILLRQINSFEESINVFLTSTSVSENELFTVHNLLCPEQKKRNQFREAPIYIGNEAGSKTSDIIGFTPHHLKVPDLISSLLNNLSSTKEMTIEKIISFYVRLLRIHPFKDGNGRVSRAFLQAMIVKNNIGFPCHELYRFQFGQRHYVESISDYDIERSEVKLNEYWLKASDWVSLFNQNINRLLFDAEQKLEQKKLLRVLSNSEKDTLDYFFTIPLLTPEKVANKLGLNTYEALRALESLEQMKVIKRQNIKLEKVNQVFVCEEIFNVLFEIDNYLFTNKNHIEVY